MADYWFNALLAAAANVTQEAKPVQNGLVFWLDALNNTGSGLNTSATTWVDLVGGNNVPVDLSGAAWQNNMCYLHTVVNPSPFHTASSVFTGSGAFTAEAVGLFPSSTTGWVCCIKTGSNNYWQVYRLSGANKMAYRANAGEAANNVFSTSTAVATLTMNANGEAVFYANGTATVTHSFSSCVRPVDLPLRLFYDPQNGYSAAGTGVYAVHLYDRALSAEEVSANYNYAAAKYGL